MLNRCLAPRAYLIGLVVVLCISGCRDEENAASNAPAATPSTATVQDLSIQGTPPTKVEAGSQYSFTPTVSGSSTRVMFSIVGQPAWARFDANTGSLIGTPNPQDEGTTGAITISASNKSSSASMAPFVIEVKVTDPNAAILSWNAPTENTDGTRVTNLAGYHVYYGTSPGELTKSITVSGATTTTCIISGLTEGTYYFAVVAYTTTGTKSGVSNLASQTI